MPHRSGLFRSPRRGRARSDRGGAGRDEPRILRLLSEHVCGVSTEQASPSRVPVHLRLRQRRRFVREPDIVGSRQENRQAMLDGQLVVAGSRQVDALPRLLGAPVWVNEMKKMYKFGVHTFYRPRAWGDGSEAPSGERASRPAAIAAKLAEAAHSSAELSDLNGTAIELLLTHRCRARRRNSAQNASARRPRRNRRRSRRSWQSNPG